MIACATSQPLNNFFQSIQKPHFAHTCGCPQNSDRSLSAGSRSAAQAGEQSSVKGGKRSSSAVSDFFFLTFQNPLWENQPIIPLMKSMAPYHPRCIIHRRASMTAADASGDFTPAGTHFENPVSLTPVAALIFHSFVSPSRARQSLAGSCPCAVQAAQKTQLLPPFFSPPHTPFQRVDLQPAERNTLLVAPLHTFSPQLNGE